MGADMDRALARRKRHQRIRVRLAGTAQRPRLAVYRSLGHIYAQVIDDSAGRTLVAASSLESEVAGAADHRTKTEIADTVGRLIGRRAREAGITRVVFDRAGFRYHGRVKTLAEAARQSGLEF